MSLRRRVEKLEARLEPEDDFHVICGPEETLDAQVEEFEKQRPDFNGLLLVVTDCYKLENAER